MWPEHKRDPDCGINCPTRTSAMLKVSVVDKNAPQNLWQASIGKLQHMPQRLQNKPFFSRELLPVWKTVTVQDTKWPCPWSYPLGAG